MFFQDIEEFEAMENKTEDELDTSKTTNMLVCSYLPEATEEIKKIQQIDLDATKDFIEKLIKFNETDRKDDIIKFSPKNFLVCHFKTRAGYQPMEMGFPINPYTGVPFSNFPQPHSGSYPLQYMPSPQSTPTPRSGNAAYNYPLYNTPQSNPTYILPRYVSPITGYTGRYLQHGVGYTSPMYPGYIQGYPTPTPTPTPIPLAPSVHSAPIAEPVRPSSDSQGTGTEDLRKYSSSDEAVEADIEVKRTEVLYKAGDKYLLNSDMSANLVDALIIQDVSKKKYKLTPIREHSMHDVKIGTNKVKKRLAKKPNQNRNAKKPIIRKGVKKKSKEDDTIVTDPTGNKTDIEDQCIEVDEKQPDVETVSKSKATVHSEDEVCLHITNYSRHF